MTRDEILGMEADQLNMAIAKLMGYELYGSYLKTDYCADGTRILIPKYDWNPFQKIEQAWKVVEKMHRNGDCLSLTYQSGLLKDDFNKLAWLAWFRLSREAYCVSTSPAEAICKAALLAMMEEK